MRGAGSAWICLLEPDERQQNGEERSNQTNSDQFQ